MKHILHSEATERRVLPQTPEVAQMYGGKVKEITLPMKGDPDLVLSNDDYKRCMLDGLFRNDERKKIYIVTRIPD